MADRRHKKSSLAKTELNVSFGKVDKQDNQDDPDPVDGKSGDQGASGLEESPIYYTGNETRVHPDKDGSPHENLEIDKKVENLTLSRDELGASAPDPFGEREFAGNQEAQEASSKNIYASSQEAPCSSSGSLFEYNKSEWIKDEASFRKFADEQCQSDPDKQKQVKQGLIYNINMICPNMLLEEYRKDTEWKLGKFLGSGTFGEVYKCKSLLTGKLHAVKKVPNVPGVRLDEIILWQKLGCHPNVCELYAVTYEEDAFWFHMELVLFADNPASNLPKYVSTLKPSTQIPLAGLLKAGGGLFEGLDHMHKQSITHRDLSNGKNIMVNTGLCLKIIDFSFIRAVTEDKQFDKDLKCGLASFFQLVTRKKKHPDNWTGDAVKDCIKDRKDVDMLLPLCEALISHLEYDSGSAIKVAGWMAEEINRRLANILLANPE